MGAHARPQLDVLPGRKRRACEGARVEGSTELRGDMRRKMRGVGRKRIAECVTRGGRTTPATQTRGGIARAACNLKRTLRRGQACPQLPIAPKRRREDVDQPVQLVLVGPAFDAIVEDLSSRRSLEDLRASTRD